MKLRVDNGAILAYRRLSYRPWYAIAEFVDNSTDAYFRGGNKKVLDKVFKTEGRSLEVEVSFDPQNKTLRIDDNSMGMSEAELEEALVIGRPPKETSGRSEFGMGMKTAAIWFAEEIEIRTKKLGDTHEIRTVIRVQDFVEGNNDLETSRTAKPKEDHYTVIELRGLIRRLGPSSLQKARSFLGSIYREDLRDGTLHLTVNGEEVVAPPSNDDDAFMTRSDKTPYVVEVDLKIRDRAVKGWVGVLKPGFTGRNQAGFALIRHGRTVKGWLDSWRPEEIFGDARNDTINQRLAGELHMDAFGASHTKDAIDWEEDDEDVLGEELNKLCKQHGLLIQAKKKTSGGNSPEEVREREEAKAIIEHQMNSAGVKDAIQLLDVPKPELAELQAAPLIDAANNDPQADQNAVVWDIGGGRRALMYLVRLSPNDPYFEYEVLPNTDLKVIINMNHPALGVLTTAEAHVAHYHHVVLEAIAEWRCTQMSEPLVAESIRLMKDYLFRAIANTTETA